MSRRPYDPFSPAVPEEVEPAESTFNPEPVSVEPVEPEPLTGHATPRDPEPAPEPEAPAKPSRARRPRRARKDQPDALAEALARLDEAGK